MSLQLKRVIFGAVPEGRPFPGRFPIYRHEATNCEADRSAFQIEVDSD